MHCLLNTDAKNIDFDDMEFSESSVWLCVCIVTSFVRLCMCVSACVCVLLSVCLYVVHFVI